MNTTELKKRAEAATPGPWFFEIDPDGSWANQWPVILASDSEVVGVEGFYGDMEAAKENAAYIAAANPAAILKLLAINAELVGALNSITEFMRADFDDLPMAQSVRSVLAKVEGGEL